MANRNLVRCPFNRSFKLGQFPKRRARLGPAPARSCGNAVRAFICSTVYPEILPPQETDRSGTPLNAIIKRKMESQLRNNGHASLGTPLTRAQCQESRPEAHALLEALPLGKAKLMEFDLIPLGPLSPLNVLLELECSVRTKSLRKCSSVEEQRKVSGLSKLPGARRRPQVSKRGRSDSLSKGSEARHKSSHRTCLPSNPMAA